MSFTARFSEVSPLKVSVVFPGGRAITVTLEAPLSADREVRAQVSSSNTTTFKTTTHLNVRLLAGDEYVEVSRIGRSIQ